jgi:hypothetical protein
MVLARLEFSLADERSNHPTRDFDLSNINDLATAGGPVHRVADDKKCLEIPRCTRIWRARMQLFPEPPARSDYSRRRNVGGIADWFARVARMRAALGREAVCSG